MVQEAAQLPAPKRKRSNSPNSVSRRMKKRWQQLTKARDMPASPQLSLNYILE